jgi:hypothetical protein
MTLSAVTVSPSAAAPIYSEVSLARLYVLRAMYLLLSSAAPSCFCRS